MKPFLKNFLISTASLFSTSCGLLESAPVPPAEEIPAAQTEAAVAETPVSPLPDSTSRIEVVWSASNEKVDGFILKYGEAPEKMENEVKIPVSELTKAEEPGHGTVFKYLLPDSYPGKTIYVSLSAWSGDNVSRATVPVKVEP